MVKLEEYIDKELTYQESFEILKINGNKIIDLISIANKTREKYSENGVHICTINNAKSGNCGENCRFCAQSSYWQTNINTYNMKEIEDIKVEYERAKESGLKTFGIVTSGKKMKQNSKEFETIIQFLKETRNDNIEICASIGLLGVEEAKILKNEGLKRYHNNIQTSPSKYHKIVATTHTIEEKLQSIKNARDVGLKVCSGGIIGMGESLEDRVNMIFTLKEIGADSIPINVLNPIKGTPLEHTQSISIEDVIKTIAMARLVLKDKTIKIAAGRETLLKDFMGTIFMAGANGMLVGGYLTTKGRKIEDDFRFIQEIEKLQK